MDLKYTYIHGSGSWCTNLLTYSKSPNPMVITICQLRKNSLVLQKQNRFTYLILYRSLSQQEFCKRLQVGWGGVEERNCCNRCEIFKCIDLKVPIYFHCQRHREDPANLSSHPMKCALSPIDFQNKSTFFLLVTPLQTCTSCSLCRHLGCSLISTGNLNIHG